MQFDQVQTTPEFQQWKEDHSTQIELLKTQVAYLDMCANDKINRLAESTGSQLSNLENNLEKHANFTKEQLETLNQIVEQQIQKSQYENKDMSFRFADFQSKTNIAIFDIECNHGNRLNEVQRHQLDQQEEIQKIQNIQQCLIQKTSNLESQISELLSKLQQHCKSTITMNDQINQKIKQTENQLVHMIVTKAEEELVQDIKKEISQLASKQEFHQLQQQVNNLLPDLKASMQETGDQVKTVINDFLTMRKTLQNLDYQLLTKSSKIDTEDIKNQLFHKINSKLYEKDINFIKQELQKFQDLITQTAQSASKVFQIQLSQFVQTHSAEVQSIIEKNVWDKVNQNNKLQFSYLRQEITSKADQSAIVEIYQKLTSINLQNQNEHLERKHEDLYKQVKSLQKYITMFSKYYFGQNSDKAQQQFNAQYKQMMETIYKIIEKDSSADPPTQQLIKSIFNHENDQQRPKSDLKLVNLKDQMEVVNKKSPFRCKTTFVQAYDQILEDQYRSQSARKKVLLCKRNNTIHFQ